jgi:hypothetical protein
LCFGSFVCLWFWIWWLASIIVRYPRRARNSFRALKLQTFPSQRSSCLNIQGSTSSATAWAVLRQVAMELFVRTVIPPTPWFWVCSCAAVAAAVPAVCTGTRSTERATMATTMLHSMETTCKCSKVHNTPLCHRDNTRLHVLASTSWRDAPRCQG